MAARQVKEPPVTLLTGKHGVDFACRDELTVGDGGTALVGALEVLDGFIGVASMEVFDLRELFVEFIEGVFGGEGVYFFLSYTVARN